MYVSSRLNFPCGKEYINTTMYNLQKYLQKQNLKANYLNFSFGG